jgi:hypothetical protein
LRLEELRTELGNYGLSTNSGIMVIGHGCDRSVFAKYICVLCSAVNYLIVRVEYAYMGIVYNYLHIYMSRAPV